MRQHIDQHAVGGQACATGAGEHASAFNTGGHHFDTGAAQHVDQGHALQIIDALGEGNQGSKGHGRYPLGDS
ncbi:hypothetical protein D3C78_1462410 [compost metagenome]